MNQLDELSNGELIGNPNETVTAKLKELVNVQQKLELNQKELSDAIKIIDQYHEKSESNAIEIQDLESQVEIRKKNFESVSIENSELKARLKVVEEELSSKQNFFREQELMLTQKREDAAKYLTLADKDKAELVLDLKASREKLETMIEKFEDVKINYEQKLNAEYTKSAQQLIEISELEQKLEEIENSNHDLKQSVATLSSILSGSDIPFSLSLIPEHLSHNYILFIKISGKKGKEQPSSYVEALKHLFNNKNSQKDYIPNIPPEMLSHELYMKAMGMNGINHSNENNADSLRGQTDSEDEVIDVIKNGQSISVHTQSVLGNESSCYLSNNEENDAEQGNCISDVEGVNREIDESPIFETMD
ncbi:MAG: hypothetical protein MHPSP_003560, partial [Paramarteilia canceri]